MTIAIILSGGIGSRIGSNVPKQYIEVGKKPIFQYSLEQFISCQGIDMVLLGINSEWQSWINEIIEKLHSHIPIIFSQAGATRQLTIYNALTLLEKQYDISNNDKVIIHDAARPLISHNLITKCLNACDHCDGILPVLPVKNTLYMSNDGQSISQLLNRDKIFIGQAPECFKFGPYLKAHLSMPIEQLAQIKGSSELAFMQGLTINLVPGEERNFKITTLADLNLQTCTNPNTTRMEAISIRFDWMPTT